MNDQPVRPPVFVSADIRVYAAGDGCARLSVAGLLFTLSEMEARALCTALRDALNCTPEVAPR